VVKRVWKRGLESQLSVRFLATCEVSVNISLHFSDLSVNFEDVTSQLSFKVTSNLRECSPEKNSYARCFQGNPHKLYINRKVIKCRIR